MSCYILSSNQIITLALGIYYGTKVDKLSSIDLQAVADICIDLYHENVKSVDYRYDENNIVDRDIYSHHRAIEAVIPHWTKWITDHDVVFVRSVIYASCRHWAYQSSEHPDDERNQNIWNKVYKAGYDAAYHFQPEGLPWGFSVVTDIDPELER